MHRRRFARQRARRATRIAGVRRHERQTGLRGWSDPCRLSVRSPSRTVSTGLDRRGHTLGNALDNLSTETTACRLPRVYGLADVASESPLLQNLYEAADKKRRYRGSFWLARPAAPTQNW